MADEITTFVLGMTTGVFFYNLKELIDHANRYINKLSEERKI